MHFDFAIFKKHPYLWGGAALGLFVILYLMLRGSGSSSGASTTAESSGQSSGDNSADLAYQAQQTATATAAGVANNQTAAALQAAENTNATNLGITQSNNQTTLGVATAQVGAEEDQYNQLADVLKTQLNDEASTQQNETNAQLSAVESQYDYLGNVATIQGQVANNEINTSGAVASQVASDQTQLSNTALSIVNKAGLNHGTASLEDELGSITQSAIGSPAAAVASAQAAGGSSVASSVSHASEVASIGSAASGVIADLI